jgi:hypothetical protein
VDPLSDSIRPQSKYFSMFWQAHPFLFLMTIGTTIKYLLKAFTKARELTAGSQAEAFQRISMENRRLIGVEAVRFARGDEAAAISLEKKFRLFDGRKAPPVLTEGAWKFLWKELKTPVMGLLLVLPLYVLTFLLDVNAWVLGLIAGWNPSVWKSLITFLCALKLPQLSAIALLGSILIWVVLRMQRPKSGPSAFDMDVTRKIREDARFIARELGVKFVTFGHTHYADIFRCSDDAWYYNTGTWMTIFSPEEQIYRDSRQFTFLKVEDGTAQLLRWNPDRESSQPVRVVDTQPAATDAEDSILKVVLGVLGRR